jgi:hypothetical protein
MVTLETRSRRGARIDDRRRSHTVTSLSDVQETGCGTQSAIGRNRTDGAVVRVASLVYGSARETSDRLTAYVQALYPVLGDYLPE